MSERGDQLCIMLRFPWGEYVRDCLCGGHRRRHNLSVFPNKEGIVEAIVERDLADLRSHITVSRSQTREAATVSMPKEIAAFIDRQYVRKRCALTLEIYAEAAQNPKVEAIVQRYAKMERELAKSLVMKFLPTTLKGAVLDARVDLLRIMADGLLVHGLYANAKGKKKAIVEETYRTFALILGVER